MLVNISAYAAVLKTWLAFVLRESLELNIYIILSTSFYGRYVISSIPYHPV